LLCGSLILFFWVTAVSGQEPPRLFIPKDFPAERAAPLSTPQLTPSGRISADRPMTNSLTNMEPVVTVPLEVLPPIQTLQKPLVLPTIKQEDLALVIQKGQELEAEALWSEALAHYESALRAYQHHDDLMDHYRVARYHCDVVRRIHDHSYLNLIQTLSAVETLHFFEEVITQIQREYAEIPRWEPLFQYGIRSFSIALADPNFRTKVNLKASTEQINVHLSAVRMTVDSWKIRDRDDMKNGLLHIAEGAQKQLGLDPAIAIMEFTCGVINSLDPNTTYLSPNQLRDQFSEIYGNLVGLGVELRSDRESLVITRVVQGSPAEESGLKVNDRILAVDGTSTRGRDTDSAANLLQGKEGTTVVLSILSAGLGQRQREVSITRRQFDVPSVEDVRMIDEQLGYLKLTRFQSKTCQELAKALNELDRQGMKCLVLDLRQNPGGLFEGGVAVASMFIEKGAIVRTQGRGRSLDAPIMTKGDTRHVPLIVLIDEESASSTEIVAGAIRDHDRGILIGKRTYGKGTVQKIIPIQTGTSRSLLSGIKLTTEKFYSPQGWAYSGVGVSPHFTIEEEKQTTAMRPLGGRLTLPLLRPATSSLDDPFIQKAIDVAKVHAKSDR